jgi:signal transduction histidine kinase
VRTRIIGLAVWAAVLAIALFGVPLSVAVLQYSVQTERDELEQFARTVAITVAYDVDDGEWIGEFDNGDSVEAAVYDDDGDWLGGDRSDATELEVTQALAERAGTWTEDGRFVVVVPVTYGDDVIGAVRATSPRSSVLPEVLPAWGAMAALAALAVTAAWLVGRRQARRLALPLEDLATGARRLGDGDFSVRTRNGGIREIDAVGAALNSTAARLDDLLARERAFSADASHQLRTPLAGLRLRLEAALEQPGRDPRPAIAASLVDADRLEATIDEILALARDDRAARAGPVDLRPLLDDLSREWRARLAPQGRALDVTIEAGTPTPRASTAAVRQVLAVLVDNATTHGAGTVAVTAREASGAVAIDVSDEGPGVDQSGSLLFARRADHRNGHGIGLALARRLAESEQGRLHLSQSSPPVFTLLLPRASAEIPTASLDVVRAGDGRWAPRPTSSPAADLVPARPSDGP